jgi:hypothetical protein
MPEGKTKNGSQPVRETEPQQPSRKTILYSDIPNEEVEWVVAGYIPMGAFSLLVGNPGSAKSLLVETWAAQLSLEGHSSLLFASEDDPTRVIGPRLSAAGADRTKISSPQDRLRLPTHLETLRRMVGERRPRLIVFDLLEAFSDVVLTTGDNAERVITPLVELAVRYSLGVVAVFHATKNARSGVYSARGSTEVAGLARSVMRIGAWDKKTGLRNLYHEKSNMSQAMPTAAFRIGSVTVEGLSAPRLVFCCAADDTEDDGEATE